MEQRKEVWMKSHVPLWLDGEFWEFVLAALFLFIGVVLLINHHGFTSVPFFGYAVAVAMDDAPSGDGPNEF